MDTAAHQLLVVANQTATSETLITELQRRQRMGRVVVHLVVPALTTRIRHWLSDIDEATSAAQARVETALEVMRHAGIRLTGEAGDGDPISALADAYAKFPADEILISTLPVERSHWLERDIIGRAEARFPVPIAHIIGTDAAERSEELVAAGQSTR